MENAASVGYSAAVPVALVRRYNSTFSICRRKSVGRLKTYGQGVAKKAVHLRTTSSPTYQ